MPKINKESKTPLMSNSKWQAFFNNTFDIYHDLFCKTLIAEPKLNMTVMYRLLGAKYIGINRMYKSDAYDIRRDSITGFYFDDQFPYNEFEWLKIPVSIEYPKVTLSSYLKWNLKSKG